MRTSTLALLSLCAACNPNDSPVGEPCSGTVVYDQIGGDLSEVTHLDSQTAFFVSRRTRIDETTSSETGGALVVGKSANVVWFEWPGGFAISSGVGPFETPDMRCVTNRTGVERTQTKCFSKEDGSLWLDYVNDARGVYEYQRHADADFPQRMRRRGECGLSFEAVAALQSSEKS